MHCSVHGLPLNQPYFCPPQYPSRNQTVTEWVEDERWWLKENRDGSKAERGIGKERLLSRSVYCKPTILLRGRLWRLWSRETRDGDTGTGRAMERRKPAMKKRRGSPATLRAHREIARGKGEDRRRDTRAPSGAQSPWSKASVTHTPTKDRTSLKRHRDQWPGMPFPVSGQRRITRRSRVTRTRNFSRKARGGEGERCSGGRMPGPEKKKQEVLLFASLYRCDTLYRSNRSHCSSTHQNVTNVYRLRNICDRFVLGHTLNRDVVTYRNTYGTEFRWHDMSSVFIVLI